MNHKELLQKMSELTLPEVNEALHNAMASLIKLSDTNEGNAKEYRYAAACSFVLAATHVLDDDGDEEVEEDTARALMALHDAQKIESRN